MCSWFSKYSILRLIAALMLTVFGAGFNVYATDVTVNQEPEHVTLYYFYENLCGSCPGEKTFMEIFLEEAEDLRADIPFIIVAKNVFSTEGSALFREITELYDISADTLDFPVLILDGKTYQGLEVIRKNLREAFIVASEDLASRGMKPSEK